METIKNPDQLTRAGENESDNTGKDNIFSGSQEFRIYRAFTRSPKTMLMVAHQTNIERANICRYIAKLKKSNQIQFVGFGLCEVSKVRAGYYQTT